MREIKFRAWCEGKHDSLTFTKKRMEYGVSVGENGGYLDIESGWDIHGEYTSIPIMQYTGLKDKNGTEIYEGDIIKVARYDNKADTSIMGVKFEDGCFNLGAFSLFNLWNIGDELEVIGNIYQNPELLENKLPTT